MKEFGLHKYTERILKWIHVFYHGYVFEDLTLKAKCYIRLRKVCRQPYINNNTVVYMADKYVSFGGLADRLRGIISLYDWCKQNNKIFKIYFQAPFSLSHYLVPNQYDWLVYDSVYQGKPILIDTPPHLADVVNFQNYMFDKYLSKGENQINCYTNADLVSNKTKFSSLFNELFKPSDDLKKLLDRYQVLLGGKYISVSFRFVQLLGDFNDCIDKTLPVDEQQKLIKKCIDALFEIYSVNHDTKMLVTADSCKFLEEVKKLDFAVVLPGEIGHSNYSHSETVHMKTFLDFLMIANANKIYLARTSKMFKSGFARKASMVNNVQFEEFIIK